jgi:hypothetical protein
MIYELEFRSVGARSPSIELQFQGRERSFALTQVIQLVFSFH